MPYEKYIMAHGQGGAEVNTDRSPTLTCNHEAPIVAQTLTASWASSGGATAGNNGGVINPIIDGSAVRRLTPRECERLQGFPDDYTRISGEKTPDGPRYKAIGNSMAVPVIAWIGSRIQEYFDNRSADALQEADDD